MYKFTTIGFFASPILLYGVIYDEGPGSFSGITSDNEADEAVAESYNNIPLYGQILDVTFIRHADGAEFLAEDPAGGYAANEFGSIVLDGDLTNATEGVSEKYGLAIAYALNKHDGAYFHIEMASGGFELNKASLLPETFNLGSVPGGDLTLLDDVTIVTPALAIANASIITTTKYVGNRTPGNDADTNSDGIDDGLTDIVVDGSATEYIQLVGNESLKYSDFDDTDSNRSLKFIVTMIAN